MARCPQIRLHIRATKSRQKDSSVNSTFPPEHPSGPSDNNLHPQSQYQMQNQTARRSITLKRKAADLDFSSGHPQKRQRQRSQSTNGSNEHSGPAASQNTEEAAMTTAQALLQGQGITTIASQEPVAPSSSPSSTDKQSRPGKATKPKSGPSYSFLDLPTPPSKTPTPPKSQPAAEAFFDDLNSLENLIKDYRRASKKMYDDNLEAEVLNEKANERTEELDRAITEHEAQIRSLKSEQAKLKAEIEGRKQKQAANDERYETCSRDLKSLSETLRKSKCLQEFSVETVVEGNS